MRMIFRGTHPWARFCGNMQHVPLFVHCVRGLSTSRSVEPPPALNLYRRTALVQSDAVQLAKENATNDEFSVSEMMALADVVGADASSREAGVVPTTVYRTDVHRHMFSSLSILTSALRAGEFVGSRGEAFRVLVGPSGVGKTSAMRSFAAACVVAFPEVLPILVNCQDLSFSGQSSLSQIVRGEVTAVLPAAAQDTSPSLAEALARLEQSGQRCLLLLDNAESLFRAADGTTIEARALSDLRWMQEQSSGRIAVALSGSSSSLPDLLSGCDSPSQSAWSTRFPLVTAVPTLRKSIMRAEHLPGASLTDSDAIVSMLPAASSGDVALQRATQFFAGSHPRSVRQFLAIWQRLHREEQAQGSSDEAPAPEPTTSTDVAALRDVDWNALMGFVWPVCDDAVATDVGWEADLVAQHVLHAIYKKNKPLLEGILTSDRKLLLNRVEGTDWSKFQPLSVAEFADAVKESKSKRWSGIDAAQVLFDRLWISPGGYRLGIPTEVYPMSLLPVLVMGSANKRKSVFGDSLVSALRSNATEIAGSVGRTAKEAVERQLRTTILQWILSIMGLAGVGAIAAWISRLKETMGIKDAEK